MFVLLIYVGYIVLWILLIFLASFISWKLFKSKAVTIMAGLVAFGAMYWPAFGDLIPTVLAHKQFCEKEAGFKVYVTREDWAKEHADILDHLVPYDRFLKNADGQLHNEIIFSQVNKVSVDGFPINKIELIFKDVKTKKILAKKTDFNRGYGAYGLGHDKRAIKIWLYKSSCFINGDKLYLNKEMQLFYKNFKIHWE